MTNLTADAPLPRKGTRVSAGAELFLAKKVVLRAGGGYDGITQNGFFTAGLAAVSEAGALDFGLRQDAFQRGDSPARHHPRRQRPPLRPAALERLAGARTGARRVKLLRSMRDDGNFPPAGLSKGTWRQHSAWRGPACAGPPTS